MTAQEHSDVVQDYLREIYKLQRKDGRATTSAIAEAMAVSPPSATSMMKKLAGAGLVEYEPYRGVTLTGAGERIALEMTRHHRLLEQYLSEKLDLPLDEVHVEADLLEHALSEKLEARIDATLGHPRHDPHGDPIPDEQLALSSEGIRPLLALEEGERAVIRRIPDDNPGLLRYLQEIGLVPGQRVQLRHAAPFGGPLTLVVGRAERAISREQAAEIDVAAA